MNQQNNQGGQGGSNEECEGSHEDETVRMWRDAFQEALFQTHVDTLKEKIRKRWGKNIDAVADEVIRVMGEEWKSSMKEKTGPVDTLRGVVRKGFQKGPQ